MEENQTPKTHNQKQEPQEEQPIFISTETMVEQEEETDPLSSFKSLLEDNKSWYSTEDPLQLQNQNENTFSNLLFTNPFDISFDFGLDPLHNFASEFNPNAHLQATQLPEMDALETHESFSLDESKKKKRRRRKEDGVPAKNLMAERRRRQKLNDRLYMLRSVVPKISKMDRASILGDAVEYMKELLQKINDLNNELNSTPSSSSLHHPSPSTPPRLPCQVKEDFCPSSFPSSTIGVPPKVEVRVGQDQAFNIQMHCVRKPGLLLSTLRSLDCLGLDIHQAVISCFNGFSLDIFRAEQCDGRPPALPEQIKAVLLQSSVGSGGLF